MTVTGRRLLISVMILAALGLSSACGKSDTSQSGAAAGPSSTAVAAAPAAGDTTNFCAIVRQQRAALAGTEMTSLLGHGSPAEWKAYFDQETAANQQVVDAAPAEIQPSMKTLQKVSLDLKAAMEAAGYDVKKMGSSKLLQSLQSPDRKQASATLLSYVKVNCGIDLSKVSG